MTRVRSIDDRDHALLHSVHGGGARPVATLGCMAERIMYVQLKTGHDTDHGPAWIARVRFSKTWNTAYVHGRILRRSQAPSANFVDVETGEEFWVSGPKRDQTDGRYSNALPEVDEDAREAYQAFLDGTALPGREHG